MATLHYQRVSGKRQTYTIEADPRGNYAILLQGKILKRGAEPLVSRGLRKPGPDVEELSIRYAKVAVDYLLGMSED